MILNLTEPYDIYKLWHIIFCCWRRYLSVLKTEESCHNFSFLFRTPLSTLIFILFAFIIEKGIIKNWLNIWYFYYYSNAYTLRVYRITIYMSKWSIRSPELSHQLAFSAIESLSISYDRKTTSHINKQNKLQTAMLFLWSIMSICAYLWPVRHRQLSVFLTH